MKRFGLIGCVAGVFISGAYFDRFVLPPAPYAVAVVDDGCIGVSAPAPRASSWKVTANGR